MKSEIVLQFSPEPIDEPIFLDSGSVGRDERFGFLHTAVQAVKVGKQERIVEIRYAAILLAFEEPNCIASQHLQHWHSQAGMAQIEIQFGQFVTSNRPREIS